MTVIRLLIFLCLAGIACASDCKTLTCQNAGTWKEDGCRCECSEKYAGDTCAMLKCPDKESPNCGRGLYQAYNCRRSPALQQLCPIMCGVCLNTKESSPRYVVELYIVVEWQVVRDKMREGNTYEEAKTKIESDVAFTIGEVNRYYRSMEKHDLYIEFRVKTLEILYQDNVLTRTTALGRASGSIIDDFGFWLFVQDSYRKHNYDIALLLTGLLWRRESTTYGVAKTKKVCQGLEAHTVAGFEATQGSIYIIAHELAHVLGAEHDVDTDCKWTSPNYVMHWRKQQYHESFGFSSCSAKGIKDNISNQTDSCLRRTTIPTSGYDISNYYDDDVMNPDIICQRVFRDKDIQACPTEPGDNVCRKLLCDRGTFCEPVMPTEGFKCGTDGRCAQGVCKGSNGTMV